ncbi:MAG: hemerythrin domain-containing protein [Myxococcota bacterium]
MEAGRERRTNAEVAAELAPRGCEESPVPSGASLRPSDVRARVLAEHRELSAQLERVEALARATLQGELATIRELRAECIEMVAWLRDHFRLEERILVPVLRDLGPRGAESVQRFIGEHERQRAIIAALYRSASTPTASSLELALLAWGFVRLLRLDMRAEEKLYLGERLLRDAASSAAP